MSEPISTQTAIFAAGCFWGVEHEFRQINGVLDAQVGYTGGTTANPTYQEVCNGDTMHAEAVKVEFDPSVVSFQELVEAFWDLHDPTQRNRQGPDYGTQYRSAIFYVSDEQRQIAEKSRSNAQPRFSSPIATEIVAADTFWPAEEYHQRYFEKQGIQSCNISNS